MALSIGQAVNASELESKIFFAIKFIVKPLAIPDRIAVDAAEAATREIVRYQKERSDSVSTKEKNAGLSEPNLKECDQQKA